MLGLASNTAALRKVKVRSAEVDVLLGRRQFERALAGVDWKPSGLPPGAILVVRRLSPARREGTAAGASFGERVSVALRGQASRARRPWLHADAIEAEAVLFTDEAELIACLVRDWLRGLVMHRWWWRSVLLDASPSAWLRREVLPRAERLVPAIALLATQDEAVEFVTRLEPAECVWVATMVAYCHAVPLAAGDGKLATARSSRHPMENAAPAGGAAGVARREALRRLLHEVPELRRSPLDAPQRRLLALALALTRAPTWARTPEIGIALDALDDPQVTVDAGSLEPLESPATPRPAAHVQQTARTSSSGHSEPHGRKSARSGDSVAHASSSISTGHRHLHTIDSPPLEHDAPGARRRSKLQRATQARESAAAKERIARAAAKAATKLSIDAVPAPVDATLGMARAPSHEPMPYPVESSVLIATRFGGLFYLLNAALALGIYADFTAPRAQGLALSPWDWLAMVGRAWFEEEIVADPVWAALASLAGRTPEEEPGRDFQPPSEDWFSDHLVTLHARIAFAVDAAEDDDLLALVCRHEAAIEVTAGMVHVHLALRDLPLRIRIAGLDRDPGWIPAAGRDVRFHFT